MLAETEMMLPEVVVLEKVMLSVTLMVMAVVIYVTVALLM